MIRKKKTSDREEDSVPAGTGRAEVVIDYPLEGEIITSHDYALRLGVRGADSAEISIDGKDWQPCRHSVGYWWYDWRGYGAGPHQVVARATAGKRLVKSKPRSLTVLI